MQDEVLLEIAQAVPEMTNRLLDLAEAYDDSLEPHCVYTELAAFVTDTALAEINCREVLERCLGVIESHAKKLSGDDPELLEWAFLSCIPPDVLSYLRPRFGTATRILAQHPPES